MCVPPEKLSEVFAGIVGALVGPLASSTTIRSVLRELVDDDFFWDAVDRAEELINQQPRQVPDA